MPKPAEPGVARRTLRFALPLTMVALAGIACYLAFFSVPESPVQSGPSALGAPEARTQVRTLDSLLRLPPDELAKVDIAEMNLLCATGLPGAEGLDRQAIRRYLARLDAWAQRVKFETERHLYRLTDPRYKDHAEHYKHSEARFRAEWLVDVLQNDIGVHYHAGFVPQDVEVPPFKTSKETFIHGVLEHEGAHKAFGGNCVSMPVTYAAVGRRLGYPVKLACAKEHVFCRWEGNDHPNPKWRDRFNFDGAGNGFSIDPDDFYLSWPRKTYPDQVELCGWLKSLTPQEELSVFLASRGAVLSHVSKDFGSALIALAHSARLRPDSAQSVRRIMATSEEMYKELTAAHPEAYRQMVARLDAQSRKVSKPGGLAPRVGGSGASASKVPWWRTAAGRAANLAEVERINEENRRNMERMMQPPQPAQPYRAPKPGVPNPYQPHQPTTPGQPRR